MSDPGVDGEIDALRRTASKVDGDNRAYSEDSQAVLRNQRCETDAEQRNQTLRAAALGLSAPAECACACASR